MGNGKADLLCVLLHARHFELHAYLAISRQKTCSFNIASFYRDGRVFACT